MKLDKKVLFRNLDNETKLIIIKSNYPNIPISTVDRFVKLFTDYNLPIYTKKN